ncbi:MAG: hypothetical protein UV64_C0014G0002 [Parcubacteria group bacterium GW2011_GWC1_43_11b]|nr:MAG: hypothetical protein UV64_C0014G0002 [Parcubacteria group bacterium GW2011_GWC1_43_11b]
MDNKLTSFIPKPSTTGPLNTTASRQSAPKVQGAYNFLGVLGFLTLALSLVFVASAFVYRQIILSDIYKPCADNGTCGLAESLKRDRQNLGVETLTRAKRLEMKTANGDSLLNQHIIISPLFRQVLNTLTTEGMSYRQFDFGHVDEMHLAVRGYLDDGRPAYSIPGHEYAALAATRSSACIMVEIPAWDDEADIATFLRACRSRADEYGIPLIIDDVVCGFRLALAGSCERYGVKADMVVLGKAMSATGCVSALVGRADLVGRLGQDVFYSTTFGGAPGPCSVAAAMVRWLVKYREEVYGKTTINQSINIGEYVLIEPGHLATIGRALKDGLNARGVKCIGQPERSIVVFDTDDEWLTWCGRMIERGVMIHRPNFPTMAHTLADVEKTLRAVEAIR